MSALAASSISLSRRDLKTTAAAAHGGLLVYPPSKKGKQRVAVGDRTGVVTVFSVGKRLEEVAVFNTDESDRAAARASQKPPVSCAVLFSDQLFCIRGSVLDAYSRKGKHFFFVDTNATERVHSLSVHTPFFFISGEYMVTAYKEAKELGFFMAPDRVHEMVAFPVQSALTRPERELRDFVCCLACNDRTLRLVQDNKLVEEIGCEAALTTLFFDEAKRRLYYGTEVGSIGVFDVVGEQTLRRRCSYFPRPQAASAPAATIAAAAAGGVSTTAGVTCLALFDVNVDGNLEVLAGYEDGSVQVLTPMAKSSGDFDLQSIWSGSVDEKVVSISGGAVTLSAEQPDVLVHGFSGQVIAFTLDLEDMDRHNSANVEAAEAALRHQEQRAAVAAKKDDTEAEIAWLQQVIAEKARLLADKTGATAKQAPLVAVASTFTADVSLRPVDHSAMLSLVVDADVPLECAIIRGTGAAVTFFGTDSTHVSSDLNGQQQPQQQRAGSSGRPGSALSAGSGASSPTASAVGGGKLSARSKTLAVATPLQQQEGGGVGAGSGGGGGKRLEVHLWADEGHADVLSVTLYAQPKPRTAQVKSVPLSALPLYRRIGGIAAHFGSAVEMKLALSTVTVVGDFTTRQAADWLSRLLPDMTESVAAQQLQEAAAAHKALSYFSAYLGTVLAVEHSNGLLTFTSDSLTALSTVKRHIVRQVSLGGITFRTKERVLFGSAVRQLDLLRPAMEGCAEAARQAQLLAGLRELQSSDTDLSYLPESHQRLLHAAEAVLAEAARQAQHEVYLKRSVVALYTSLVQFRANAPSPSADIRAALEAACYGTSYSTERLAKLFFPAGEDEAERDAILAEQQQQQQQQHQLDADVLGNSASDTAVLSSPSVQSDDAAL